MDAQKAEEINEPRRVPASVVQVRWKPRYLPPSIRDGFAMLGWGRAQPSRYLIRTFLTACRISFKRQIAYIQKDFEKRFQ
jgi:hypothetical protein